MIDDYTREKNISMSSKNSTVAGGPVGRAVCCQETQCIITQMAMTHIIEGLSTHRRAPSCDRASTGRETEIINVGK